MSKPVLYTFGLSVWAAAAELAVADLGYPEDAIITKIVNVAEGANFDPEFLKINPHGTLPTLVADGKAYTSTKEVISYLVGNPKAPKKVAKGTTLIDKIHDDSCDPNAPIGYVRDEEELKSKQQHDAFPFQFFNNRYKAAIKFSESPEGAPFEKFYTAKKAGISEVLAIYKGTAEKGAKESFFKLSNAHWQALVALIQEDLATALPKSGFLGGDQPGEDDFHVGAWLARVVFFTGGNKEEEGCKSLEKETKKPLPQNVVAYWKAWTARPSFQKVYQDGLH